MLKTPRQDFPLETQAAFLKTEGGGTALVGIIRGKAEGLEVQDAGGKKTVRLSVVAQAVTEDGKNAAFAEQEEAGDVRPDGTFLASYRMVLKPGKYTLKGGALEVKSAKGSLAQIPVEVPDLNKAELTATLLVLRDVEDLTEGVVDNNNAYSGLALAKVQAHPALRDALHEGRLAHGLLPVLRREGRRGDRQGLGHEQRCAAPGNQAQSQGAGPGV